MSSFRRILRRLIRRITPIAVVSSLIAAPNAHAQFTTYSSRALFTTAASPLQTELFNAPFSLVPVAGASYNIAGGTITFAANEGGEMFGGGDVFADLIAGANNPSAFVRFDFSAPTRSFGADFSSFDLPGITLSAFIGANSFTFGEGFFGVVSTTPFTSLTLRNPSDDTFFALDNVSTSIAAVTTVPEPSTLLLLIVGMAALAFVAAKKQQGRHHRAGIATLLAIGSVTACADRESPTTIVAGDTAAREVNPLALPACDSDNGGISVPAGFCAVVVADEVGTARHITVSGTGDTYVAINQATRPNGILALRDTDGDGRADIKQYFGAPSANGIAIFRHFLYVAYPTQIVRYRLETDELVPTTAPEVVVSGLPTGGDHGAKNITFDGRSAMYVNIGSPSNSCQFQNRVTGSLGQDPCPEIATRAGIWRFDALTLGQTQANGVHFATGFRNTEALRYDASRRALYGIPHGRDELHDDFPAVYTQQQQADLPAEVFTHIDQGDDNGWPYCYYDGIKKSIILAPEYGGDGSIVGPRCESKEQPIADFPGHWAPNDVMFYQGSQFPSRYLGGAFIAFHGGHDRTPLPEEGFNVVFVPFNDLMPQPWEVFADGFTGGRTPLPQNAAHRPMGLAEGPDGSLYVTDDVGGRVWRISYRGAQVQ